MAPRLPQNRFRRPLARRRAAIIGQGTFRSYCRGTAQTRARDNLQQFG